MASTKSVPLSNTRRNTLLRMIALFGIDETYNIILERKSQYPFDALYGEMIGNHDQLRKEAYDYILRFKLNATQYKEGDYNESV